MLPIVIRGAVFQIAVVIAVNIVQYLERLGLALHLRRSCNLTSWRTAGDEGATRIGRDGADAQSEARELRVARCPQTIDAGWHPFFRGPLFNQCAVDFVGSRNPRLTSPINQPELFVANFPPADAHNPRMPNRFHLPSGRAHPFRSSAAPPHDIHPYAFLGAIAGGIWQRLCSSFLRRTDPLSG